VKVFITGFSNSGKTTIFNALTGLNLETTNYSTLVSDDTRPHKGVVKVPDKRLEKLSSIYKPKKTTHATIEYIDYPGLIPTSSAGDISQNSEVFSLMRDADAIVQVVRVFEDESVAHPLGSIDPLRDIKSFETELILEDLEFIEKRLERMELAAKKGKKQDESVRQFLFKCRETLEGETPLRGISFNEEEKRLMSPFQFLSIVPEIIVLNIGEDDINRERIRELHQEVESYLTQPVISLCGKIEMEIAQLSDEEARAFLDDLGIKEQATHKLCRLCYETLDLISFFTVIRDEVRAWTIRRGTTALKAAGKVHSDMERGFIRAEVVSFEDFISSGEDVGKARDKGLLRLEGKAYIVKDGDIINFRFKV